MSGVEPSGPDEASGTNERTGTSPSGPVLVTGGASGLGAAVVELLVERGARVVVLDRRPPTGEVEHRVVDLADPRAAERTVRDVADGGPLAAVVGAAGTDCCGRFEDVDAAAWEQVVQVNLIGLAAVVRAALPGLRAGRGRIVNVASTLAERSLPDATAYCASKAAVVAFGRVLAQELAPEVGVTTLVPGGMATAFFDGRPEQYRPGADARLNDPRDVARSVLFALDQPWGCEVRELTICPSTEPSWP